MLNQLIFSKVVSFHSNYEIQSGPLRKFRFDFVSDLTTENMQTVREPSSTRLSNNSTKNKRLSEKNARDDYSWPVRYSFLYIKTE